MSDRLTIQDGISSFLIIAILAFFWFHPWRKSLVSHLL
jgi:hypothetical protein